MKYFVVVIKEKSRSSVVAIETDFTRALGEAYSMVDDLVYTDTNENYVMSRMYELPDEAGWGFTAEGEYQMLEVCIYEYEGEIKYEANKNERET